MNILANWHLGRVLRLIFGLYAVYLGVFNKDFLSGIIGAFFLYQALSNTGCCANNACSATSNGDLEQNTDNVEFEEITVDKKY
jgi:hypothetical protein